jgi:hypothetical protein
MRLYSLSDWDVILSTDCPVGALSHLMCCDVVMIVVAPRITQEWRRAFLKIQGWSGPPLGRGLVNFLRFDSHGSPRYSRGTGFLKKAETVPHLWLIVCIVNIAKNLKSLTGMVCNTFSPSLKISTQNFSFSIKSKQIMNVKHNLNMYRF